MRFIAAGIIAMFALVLVLSEYHATEGGDKKVSVKTVMKEHKKGGLRAKVLAGGASEAERKKLVELYKAACACDPPKGDKKAWVKRWKNIVAAATQVAKDDSKKARKILAKATNCKSCHSMHRK